MRVTPFAPAVASRRTGKTAPGQPTGPDDGFASLLSPTAAPAAPAVGPSVSAANADVLLACQSEQQRSPKQEKTIAHGMGILDALDGVRLSLLDNDLDPASLRRLQEASSQHQADSGDSGLDEVVAWANVCAAVELAKRDTQSPSTSAGAPNTPGIPNTPGTPGTPNTPG